MVFAKVRQELVDQGFVISGISGDVNPNIKYEYCFLENEIDTGENMVIINPNNKQEINIVYSVDFNFIV